MFAASLPIVRVAYTSGVKPPTPALMPTTPCDPAVAVIPVPPLEVATGVASAIVPLAVIVPPERPVPAVMLVTVPVPPAVLST